MKNRIPVVSVQLVEDGMVESASSIADSPVKAAPILRDFIGRTRKEHFVVMLLDARNKVVGINLVSMGTLTASLVHPRECFQPAILASAAGVIVAHNHPSGDCQPSPEDKQTTKRLADAGRILGIPVLDHVIITAKAHFSFREAGLLS